MKNLFDGLQIVGGETKIVSITETASVEVSGRFSMERGNFKQEFSYWTRTYEKFGNFAKIDDYETEQHKCTLGELPIDSLSKLVQTLNDSGLTTLANSLGFTSEEITSAMHHHIQEHKIFKAVYGKKAELWDLLTKEEQQAEILVYTINNYDTCGDWYKRQCDVAVLDEEGNAIPNAIPTIEQLKEKFEQLSN
jgi:hypothetical protein